MCKFILSIFLFAGCAGFQAIEVSNIDPEFQSYVEDYNELKKEITGQNMRKDITVYFYSLSGTTVGLCSWHSDGSREILIDPEYWYRNSTTDEDRTVLIYHELGHCDLDRNHIDPSSILEAYHIGGVEYVEYEDYYDNELFGKTPHLNLTKPSLFKSVHEHLDLCGGIHKFIK